MVVLTARLVVFDGWLSAYEGNVECLVAADGADNKSNFAGRLHQTYAEPVAHCFAIECHKRKQNKWRQRMLLVWRCLVGCFGIGAGAIHECAANNLSTSPCRCRLLVARFHSCHSIVVYGLTVVCDICSSSGDGFILVVLLRDSDSTRTLHAASCMALPVGVRMLDEIGLICQKEFTQYLAESLGTCICEHCMVTQFACMRVQPHCGEFF